MSRSLWEVSVGDLLSRTASSDPTPGGGSVAAVCGALGVGLIRMAVAVTADARLDADDGQLLALQAQIVAAADADVEDFEAIMTAYRLPRADDDGGRRRQAIEVATSDATEGPLALVGALVAALESCRDVEPLVKRTVVSDVLAGRDLVVGAARAALHTVDINLGQLDSLAAAGAPGLRERRDDLLRRLEAAT